MATQTGLVDYIKRGAHDDNLEGVVLTKLTKGDLARVPLPINVQAVAVGTATASQGTTNNNPDGSMWGATLTVPAGLGNSAALKGLSVYGRFIAIRIQRTAVTTNPRITVVVNGVAYSFRNTSNRRDNAVYGATDQESLLVVSAQDLLNDGPHTVEMILASDPYGGTSHAVTVLGFVAERAKGYTDYPPMAYLPAAATTLSTSTTSLQSTTANPVRKLFFQNTDVAQRIVTIKSGSTTFATITLAAAGTDAASGSYDFGATVNLIGFTAQADAASKVNMWIMAGGRVR